MSVTVYGSSDDLIEIEGALYDEFPYLSDDDGDGDLLAFSNGVVLRVRYSDSGVWRIAPVVTTEAVTITPAPEDDEDNYSDRAELDDQLPIKWVVHGIAIAQAKA